MKTQFGLILLLWLAGLGAAGQYGKVSVIYDQLPDAYPDAGTSLGFMVSLVGTIGILFGVVAGLMVARVGYRRALIVALWAGAMLSLVQAAFPPLALMLVTRVLEGVSHLAIVVAAPTLIAQVSAPRHRGFTLSLWSTFFGVAYTLLVWWGLPLVAAAGLPALFVAHAVWMALFAVLLSRTLHALPASTRSTDPLNLRQIARAHLHIYRSAFVAAPAFGWLFYTICFLAILTLIPPFIDPAVRAIVLGTMPLVSIASALTLGVWLIRLSSAIAVVIGGFVGAILCLIWLRLDPGAPAACIALFGALGLVQGASFAAVPELNTTAQAQAQANGAMAQMGNIGNTTGTPILAAMIVMGGFDALMLTAIAVLTTGLAVHLWLARVRRLA